MKISFHLNGERVDLAGVDPQTTLLDWLREERALTGTKEGCNEGDCGACTVMIRDDSGLRALNACILLMPQLHGRSVVTVEGLASRDGSLHPVQKAMVTHHGSQCGFCTPGIVMSLAVAHAAGEKDVDAVLAGNLCRCTGYAPIVRAAEAARAEKTPDDFLGRIAPAPVGPAEDDLTEGAAAVIDSADALADWCLAHPEGHIVGGATDLGLHVTKGLKELGPLAFVGRCRDLKQISISGREMTFGAGVSIADMARALIPMPCRSMSAAISIPSRPAAATTACSVCWPGSKWSAR